MHNYFIEIGWQDQNVTLDLSAFLLDAQGRVRSETDFVFYGTPKSPNGTITTSTGSITLNASQSGKSGFARMDVALQHVPDHVTKIVFVAAVYLIDHPAEICFGRINGSSIRIVDTNDESELLRYELWEDCQDATAIRFCEFTRVGNAWSFSNIGDACRNKLPEIAGLYGVRIPEHQFDRMHEQRMKEEEEKRRQREEKERRKIQAEQDRLKQERLEKEKRERENANELRKQKAEEKRAEYVSIAQELIILCSECSRYHGSNTENKELKTEFSDANASLLTALEQDGDIERVETAIREVVEKLRKLKLKYDNTRRKSYLFWRVDSWTRWDAFINSDLFTIEFRREIAKQLQK